MSFVVLRFSGALTLGVTLLLGSARPAAAQDAGQAENIAAARQLGIEGVELAEAGKCDQAIERLSRADALYHAPTILDRLGECQIAVGQIVLGTENLNRVVREPLAANAPKAFRDAQARAKKALDAALPRIGRLTISVEPTEAQANVTVSGAPVPAALLGAERPTDPGTHEIVASAPGYLTERATVALAEGGHETVALRLTIDPSAAKVAASPAAVSTSTPPPAPPPPAPAAESSTGTRTLAYVLLGTGAVGITVGSITGAMALQKKSDLDCPNNQCGPSQADTLDSAKGFALASTIGFAVGIPAATIGAVLLLTSSKSEQHAAKVPPRRFVAEPYLSPTGGGMRGSFW
jgi:hypothetical protein